MYFEFEDYKPDITPVGSAISWREGVLLSIIVHLRRHRDPARAAVVPGRPDECAGAAGRARRRASARARRFVFVQPSVDLKALKPPDRAEPSDQDREARSRRTREATDQSAAVLARQHARTRRADGQGGAREAAGPTPDRRPASRLRRSPSRRRRRRENQPPLPEAHRPCSFPTQPASAAKRRERSATSVGRLARRRAAQPAALRAARSVREPAGRRRVRSGDSVRYQGRRVRPLDPPLHRAGQAQLADSVRGDVDERARRRHLQRPQGRHASPI